MRVGAWYYIILLVIGGWLAVASGAVHAAGKAVPRGGDWDSIKQLPDWSGVWAPQPPGRTARSRVHHLWVWGTPQAQVRGAAR
jgi:hypothetical protein